MVRRDLGACHESDTIRELEEFPPSISRQSNRLNMKIESLDGMTMRVRIAVRRRHLRPGGTVFSGPTLMFFCRCRLLPAGAAQIGPVPLAVTTNLNINFMASARQWSRRDRGNANFKWDRSLAVGDVLLFSDGRTGSRWRMPDDLCHSAQA